MGKSNWYKKIVRRIYFHSEVLRFLETFLEQKKKDGF